MKPTEELKEVSFSAGALRVAGFTSKQLQDALYSLRDMQRGGYPWKDLVIFLRATCAELTHAGYTHLDPKHRLFLEYRYEPLAEEAPPAEQVSTPTEEEPGRKTRREVPLLPRWPLGTKDARATGEVKSSKTARIAPPLRGAPG